MTEHKTIFSPCRQYRYTLWRDWSELFCDDAKDGFVQFIGLNPSTADEVQDDPTIRRCIGFAKVWGYGALCMTNLFAFRATDPNVMKASGAPVGEWSIPAGRRIEKNNEMIIKIAKEAAIVVCAWGTHGKFMDRGADVLHMLKLNGITPLHLGLTSGGFPKHPLYLKKDLKPIPF